MEIQDRRVRNERSYALVMTTGANRKVTTEADALKCHKGMVHVGPLQEPVERGRNWLLEIGPEPPLGKEAQGVHLPRTREKHEIVSALDRRVAALEVSLLHGPIEAADHNFGLPLSAAPIGRHEIGGQRHVFERDLDRLERVTGEVHRSDERVPALDTELAVLGRIYEGVVLGCSERVRRLEILIARADAMPS